MARQISVLIFSVVSRDLVNDLDLNLTPLLEVFFLFLTLVFIHTKSAGWDKEQPQMKKKIEYEVK